MGDVFVISLIGVVHIMRKTSCCVFLFIIISLFGCTDSTEETLKISFDGDVSEIFITLGGKETIITDTEKIEDICTFFSGLSLTRTENEKIEGGMDVKFISDETEKILTLHGDRISLSGELYNTDEGTFGYIKAFWDN